MARNVYFSEGTRSEQLLYEDIVIESLKIYGQDLYYLPRETILKDDILNEDPSSRFSRAYMIEMYIDNVEGFDGGGDLFTKFGVEIRDQVTLTMARRRWAQAVQNYANDLKGERPLEGDLIYLPMARKLFQIMRVEHEDPFYQLNNLATYKLICELYEFNEDDFDTGVATIDAIEEQYAQRYIIEFTPSNRAAARAETDSAGRVSNIIVTNAGLNYTQIPTVTVGKPTLDRVTATGTAQGTAAGTGNKTGTITSLTVTNPGKFYNAPPTVSIDAPSNHFAKFGTASLHHDSVGESTLALITTVASSTIGNRRTFSWWYWCDSSTTDNVLFSTPKTMIYHRSADNKIVLLGDSAGGNTAVSTGTIDKYNSGTDSGKWNYIELHLLDNSARIFVNGVNSPNQSFIGTALNLNVGERTILGKPEIAIDSSKTDGFIGYIDNIVLNKTTDTEFRDANPIPVTTIQQEQDADTLAQAEQFDILRFDNIIATASATIETDSEGENLGTIKSLNIIDGGRGYGDSAFTLTISAPTGTVEDFTATATVENINADTSINNIVVNRKGNYYTSVPAVSITAQLNNISFEKGDTAVQTLSDGTVISGEVVKYSDSDNKLHLINIKTSDGKFHAPVQGIDVYKDSANSPFFATALSVTLQSEGIDKTKDIEQNAQFDSAETKFLDFSESNPFGDPR